MGGGNTVLVLLSRRRVERTSVGSGTEPAILISIGFYSIRLEPSIHSPVSRGSRVHILCARSISDEVRVVFPLRRTRVALAGDFSGEEKMPSKFSMPCSSLELTGRVMPVLLSVCQSYSWSTRHEIAELTVLAHRAQNTGWRVSRAPLLRFGERSKGRAVYR